MTSFSVFRTATLSAAILLGAVRAQASVRRPRSSAARPRSSAGTRAVDDLAGAGADKAQEIAAQGHLGDADDPAAGW